MQTFARRVVLFLLAAAVVAALVYGLMPVPVEVDMAEVTRGDIRDTVDQDGKTRIRERYIVSAPLAGRLLRIDLDPGDEVTAGTTLLAVIEPRDPELLDARSILQAEAAVRAAESKLKRMSPLLEEAIANQTLAESELRRVRDARQRNPQSISESEIEGKLMTYQARAAMVRSAQYAEDIARFELEQARAALLRSRPPAETSGNEAGGNESDAASGDGATDNGTPPADAAATVSGDLRIFSPITGRVLRVFQESSAVVTPGVNLLELGDPVDLEVEIDVLSRDAVRIKPGAAVLLEHWGGDRPLHGTVRLVEPSAFTKISTLGVEEQRVNVIVDLVDPPEQRTALGDGFRVEARIVAAEASDVVKAPTSSLFRAGDQWAVFQVIDGVAHQQTVTIGLQNGLEAEVLAGLAPGDAVIVHPGDNVAEGVEVAQR
ncbi:MAG: HlyD family efflux transporter periplasmic adaptor subunit [Planctomycetales bacterium]|nr:HlyD family efflux transporter periplasmic adaptor subunit [Planctomycetales bacterium]